MWALVVFVAGVIAGACGYALRLELRVQRARLDLRPAMSRRPFVTPASAGVVVRRVTPASAGVVVRRARPTMGEPPNVPLRDIQAFDEEHTQ